ncbi:gamma interferon responsive lysosomal thiol (GILT) reductase family protein [Raphanus sativus]|uniref:Gamma-interferon-responsive lysosomal thiol protein n=1 Tax=Raphanus sativus TaxID=3726 RepID=A0A9W3DDT8_RAPSA|nr:gamma-interferon-responsive lysosomal thiol protein [Raphanus sativus]KAJ4908938.1 gamma interferon responsive lysosomal thiol (GILT) reductase family protein [Raphanus sativus]
MASYQKLVRFYITIFFCFFLSLSSSQKVTLSLYYEALCPFCADFIVNHLPQIFRNGLISSIDLHLVPWGNALFKPDATILCQHGEAECALNAIHACAIDAYPDVMKHVGYIYCTERLVLENKLEKWADCFELVGLSRAALDCYINGYGHQLELKYAEETSELNPAHTFVPWVVVNNQPLQENYQNFVMYVCNAYGSSQVPEACRNLNNSVKIQSTFNSSVEKLSYSHQVCYANQ